jgi:hypothetical protein
VLRILGRGGDFASFSYISSVTAPTTKRDTQGDETLLHQNP